MVLVVVESKFLADPSVVGLSMLSRLELMFLRQQTPCLSKCRFMPAACQRKVDSFIA